MVQVLKTRIGRYRLDGTEGRRYENGKIGTSFVRQPGVGIRRPESKGTLCALESVTVCVGMREGSQLRTSNQKSGQRRQATQFIRGR